MQARELGKFVHQSKYAMWLPDKLRRETWPESVDRMMDMHARKYKDFPEVLEAIEKVRKLVKSKLILGSQRNLQFGGPAVEKHNARAFNCSASQCDRISFFQEFFWLSLCGCGCGFSVQLHHINKLPCFAYNPKGKIQTHYVEDSIEGWADCIGILLQTYFGVGNFPEWNGKRVKFDFSFVRPEGAPISSCNGKAPGPEPLKRAMDRIRGLLDRCVEDGQEKLRSIDAYDVCMHLSDAVISGGVRRAACLCMFSLEDDLMMEAKTGDWFYTNPQRGRSNNSVVLLRDSVDMQTFLDIFDKVKQFGEPGFIWVEDKEALYNPCVEAGLYGYDENGDSGFGMCNLCEINGAKIKTWEDFEEAAWGAAVLGTLQAGYTSFPYLSKATQNIVEREALLGVSITGFMDNPHILLDPAMQRKAARLVKNTNIKFASIIGINPSARNTLVKPSGNSSCVLQTGAGIHLHHSVRTIRRVQCKKNDPVFQFFASHNPEAVEDGVWSVNNDAVISFCLEVPDGAKTKNQMGAIEFLECVKLTQANWVEAGKNKDACIKPWLTHNVSNTVHVKDDEWDDVASYIYKNRKWFGGISLISLSGDLDYPQAPYTSIKTPHQLVSEYGDGSMFASGLIVDGLHSFNTLWEACDAAMDRGVSCIVYENREPNESPFKLTPTMHVDNNGVLMVNQNATKQREDWVRRFHQFKNRYCEGDAKKCEYLLKDVSNWKKWVDLQRTYVKVPYKEMVETEDNTTRNQTLACSGGQCEIIGP